VIQIDELPTADVDPGRLRAWPRPGLSEHRQTTFIELVGQDGQNPAPAGCRRHQHPGGYGAFAADVPYTVTEVTPALLVVYESGGTLSEIAHLASVELLLSP
jgi:hypothetical protein